MSTDFFEAVDLLKAEENEPAEADDFFAAVDQLKGEGDPDDGKAEVVGPGPTLIRELEPYWTEWTNDERQADCEPLRVLLEVDGVTAGYDAPTLDGILARMVTDEALSGDALDGSGGPYVLPVPLFRLWADPETRLPLWACNSFTPAGPNAQVTEYWHKRSIRSDHARKQKGQRTPYSIKGRYKEKRVPLPAQTARYWWADCIGYRPEVLRLMQQLRVFGKKRMALVRNVRVQKIERFQMQRPVPLHYFDESTDVQHHGYTGWTPPYWLAETQTECGVPV